MKIVCRLIKDKLKSGPVGNGNDLSSVLVAYSMSMKNTHENISRILNIKSVIRIITGNIVLN